MNYCQFRNLTIKRMANAGGGLPSIYQAVEYLESSGTQHIVTSIPMASYVETRCKGMFYSDSVVYGALVGGRNNNDNSGRYIPLSTTNITWLRFVYGSSELNIEDSAYNTQLEIVFNDSNKNVYCNSTLLGSYTGTTLNTSGQQNIALFGMSGYNGANVDWKAKGRLYYAAFYDNRSGDALADYIPCYRKSDNKPGMYDLVTDAFYTNAGSGEFTVGNNV